MELQNTYKGGFQYFIEGFKYGGGNIDSILYLENIFRNIDNGILIIDDILDDSEFRNNEVCLYKSKGIKFAIIEAEKNIYSSLCELENNELKSNILNFLNKVIKGQKIDFNLENNNIYDIEDNLKKYFEMIRLFTGGHVADNFGMGYQLSSGKTLDNLIYNQLESVGTLRQIYDDIDDYGDNHHERFGDFIRSNKRLPEIIYIKNGGDRDIIMNYIKEKNEKEVIMQIFNKINMNTLNEYIDKYKNQINTDRINFGFVKEIINKKLKLQNYINQ